MSFDEKNIIISSESIHLYLYSFWRVRFRVQNQIRNWINASFLIITQ